MTTRLGTRSRVVIRPLIAPKQRAHTDAHRIGDYLRRVRVVDEEVTDEVGRQPEDRPDREVDVPRDDDERLSRAEQGDQRGSGEQLLDARPVGEGVVLPRGQHEHEDDRDDDAELAGPGHALEQPTRPLVGTRDGGGRGHVALPVSWPVAARMIDASSASARASSATSRPSRITRTRSAMPSTSGSSEEIIRTATP